MAMSSSMVSFLYTLVFVVVTCHSFTIAPIGTRTSSTHPINISNTASTTTKFHQNQWKNNLKKVRVDNNHSIRNIMALSSTEDENNNINNNNNDSNKDEISKTQIENQMIQLQKEKSNNVGGNDADDTNKVKYHLQRQEEVFDNLSDFFNSDDATPEDVKPLLSFIIQKALSDMIQCSSGSSDDHDDDNDDQKPIYHVLDVGCGVGALFPFYVQEADKLGIRLHVTGIDLSSKMITCAKENANALLEGKEVEGEKHHLFAFENKDFVQFALGDDDDDDGGDGGDGGNKYDEQDRVLALYQGISNEQSDKQRGQYDAVVINACFGNFYNPGTVWSCVWSTHTFVFHFFRYVIFISYMHNHNSNLCGVFQVPC
jgi:2-polyprenyl-3-methyl-5-hydroxy-6-metoxy-1,4-benzoquinol methylase